MAVAYFSPTLALDANNSLQQTAEAQVYAAEDTSFSSPLAITDLAGIPFADNKLRAENFLFPAFLPPAGVTQVIVRSGDMMTPLTSVSVERQAAVEAAAEAAARAGEAVAAAQAAVTARDTAQAAAAFLAALEANALRYPWIADEGLASEMFSALGLADPPAQDRVITLFGDSTGNQLEEWFGAGANAVRPLFPKWRVLWHTFNSGSTSMNAPTILQAGVPAGDPVPVDGTVAADAFGRTVAELNGDIPDQGLPWSVTLPGYYEVSAGKARQKGNESGLATARLAYEATGDVALTARLGVSNAEAVSKQHRINIKWVNDSNLLRLNFAGSITKTITIVKIINGVSTTIATLASGAIPNNAAYAEYDISFSVIGTSVSATVNGTTATATISADDAVALANGSSIGWGSNSVTATLDNLVVDVDGLATSGEYATLHFVNGSVPGTTLDYQTANSSRLASILSVGDPDVIVMSGGHNYDSDSPATFIGKLDAAFALVQAQLDTPAVEVVFGQNPQILGGSAATHAVAHNARQQALRGDAASKGRGYIPGFEVYNSRWDRGASLINVDGVHPLFAGTVAEGNGSALLGDVFAQWWRRQMAAA